MAGKESVKKQGKLVYFILAITIVIVTVLTIFQVEFVKMRTRKSVAESYEEDCRKITDAYTNVVCIRLSEYIKQMRMYIEADITKTEDPVQIQKWLIDNQQFVDDDFCATFYYDVESKKSYFSNEFILQADDKPYIKNASFRSDYYISDIYFSNYTDYPVFIVEVRII